MGNDDNHQVTNDNNLYIYKTIVIGWDLFSAVVIFFRVSVNNYEILGHLENVQSNAIDCVSVV